MTRDTANTEENTELTGSGSLIPAGVAILSDSETSLRTGFISAENSPAADAATATSTVPSGSGLLSDIVKSAQLYRQDWANGFVPKTASAVLLLYVACLAPTVSFGGLCSFLTEGNLGVVEFLVSHGAAGILYSCELSRDEEDGHKIHHGKGSLHCIFLRLSHRSLLT